MQADWYLLLLMVNFSLDAVSTACCMLSGRVESGFGHTCSQHGAGHVWM